MFSICSFLQIREKMHEDVFPLFLSLSKLPLIATENKCCHFNSKIKIREFYYQHVRDKLL